jgi:hypothetical protein
MNKAGASKQFLDVMKPENLTPGAFYPANIIKRLNVQRGASKFQAYVVESDNFQLYLPDRYLSTNLTRYVPGRVMEFLGFVQVGNSNKTRAEYIFHYPGTLTASK